MRLCSSPRLAEIPAAVCMQSPRVGRKGMGCHLDCAAHQSSSAKHSVGATSLNTLIQLVAGKLGTTLVPEMALEQLIENNALLSKARLSESGPHRRIAFIVRPNYSGVNNIELLMAQFKASLKQHFSKSSD